MNQLLLWIVNIATVMNSEVEKTKTAQVKKIIRRGEGIKHKKTSSRIIWRRYGEIQCG